MTWVAGLLAGVTISRTAAAQEGFQRHLDAAILLYESLEYERALTQINLARGQQHDSAQEVTLSLYEGIFEGQLGHEEACQGAFKSALLVQPEARLPLNVGSKISSQFESVRAQAQRELAARAPKPPPQPPPPKVSPASGSNSEATGFMDLKALRRHALIPAVAGGSLVVAGGISWALSRGELNKLRNTPSSFQSAEDVQHSVSRGNTLQTLGITLLGVGATSLAAAGALHLMGAPDEPIAVGLATDGRSAVVYGRWP